MSLAAEATPCTWLFLFTAIILATPAPVFSQGAQPGQPPDHQHQHMTEGAAPQFDARESSGTAWQPDLTPMFAVHKQLKDWTVMLHGTGFVQFLYESGESHHGSHQGGSINWIMAMARRPAGSGRFGLRLMASLEPWTIPGCGYPDLLATGEMCDGDTIHDRQHPHDLFMEVSADYDRPIGRSLRWQIYAGLAGEPALGPPAFPHRLSAMPNPVAPIAHHWLDSTHITFGVVTTGIYAKRWKTEMSVFNGREPDEHRADFDFGKLDSISGRLWYLPAERWAMEVSAGHLNEAEAEFPPEPRADVDRVTASVSYHRPFRAGTWATTSAYGMNSERGVVPGGHVDEVTHAFLVESSLSTGERHTWFGRFEVAGKPAHDLHVHEFITEVFTVGKIQGGYVRYFDSWRGLQSGVGFTVSASLLPEELASRYDGRVAPGFGVFFTLRPSRHAM
jgi:hypothetical protein